MGVDATACPRLAGCNEGAAAPEVSAGRQCVRDGTRAALRSWDTQGATMGIGTPFTVLSTATRHMLDTNVTFGMSSSRFNARDRYRREYSDEQRLGAGIGTAFGAALPAVALGAWVKRGASTPLAPKNLLGSASGKAMGVAVLGAATAAGAWKLKQISEDDGHLGAAGAATGIVAGTVAGAKLGQHFAGKYAPLVSGLGAIGGGIAGYMGGSRVAIGDGNIGKEHVQAPQVDESALDRVGSFGRGAFTHFSEVGPTSQGISFGYAWDMRKAYNDKYSNAERAGAMHGDLLAGAVLGGGALAVAGGLLGVPKFVPAGMTGGLQAGANAAGHVLERGHMTSHLQKLGGKGPLGIGAAAAGLTGVVAWKEYDRMLDASGGDAGKARLAALGSLGATAGAAALVSMASSIRGMSAAPRAASSALVAAALIGVLSSVRMPMQQFVNDAKAAHRIRGGIDPIVSGAATGVGALAGGIGAFRGLGKLVPAGGIQLGRFHLPKAAVVGVGTALSAAAIGGVGFGLSATMPDAKTVGMSAVGGAVAGAAFGKFARGVGVVPGIIGGAMLGMSGSALLQKDAPATDAPSLQDAPAATLPG